MNQERYKSLLALGSEQVPFGVYAIEKDGQAEMRFDHCKSITQLKKLIRQFKAAGYKVMQTGGNCYGYTRIYIASARFL